LVGLFRTAFRHPFFPLLGGLYLTERPQVGVAQHDTATTTAWEALAEELRARTRGVGAFVNGLIEISVEGWDLDERGCISWCTSRVTTTQPIHWESLMADVVEGFGVGD
jgi:hypothetical protein